jgi:hypothetical protein
VVFSIFGSSSVPPRQILRVRLTVVRFESNFENIDLELDLHSAARFASVSPSLERPALYCGFCCRFVYLGNRDTTLEFWMNDPENSHLLMGHDVVGAEAARAVLSQNRGEALDAAFGGKYKNRKFRSL